MKTFHAAEPEMLGSTVSDVEKRAFQKIAWRLLPVLILSYIFNYIDRTNIAVASLTMIHDVGLTPSQFGYGAGILFLGYCLFEVPSNLALYSLGARNWLVRIMITWGIVSAAMALVAGPKSFYLLRFLLGVAEAGFFPGVAYFLSLWFPSTYRARVLAWFLVGIPASSIVGAPLSGLLMKMQGMLGLAGWQWIFILESIPCILLGIALYVLMTERPADAKWLSADERSAVISRIASEQFVKPVSTLKGAFTDRRVWILSGIYLGFSIGSYGIQIWLPQIIKQAGFADFTVTLLTVIPYFFAVVGMIIWASVVDKTGKRIGNVIAACLVGSIGFVWALTTNSFVTSMFGLTVALVGVNAARVVFWAVPGQFLTGIAAAGGLAIINSVGTMGGFVGPSVMGWLKQETGSYTMGLVAMAGFLFVAALLALWLGLTTTSANKPINQ